MKIAAYLGGVTLYIYSVTAFAINVSGYISVQDRFFLDEPLDPRQHNNYASVAIEPEFYHSWDDDSQSITVKPFYRNDNYDDERTHADVRELSWQKVFDEWELRAGISKVYWGVTETQHLVDIVNQTDQVENIDGEDKLGQPMIRFSTEQNWGVLDFFILPGFRERTFAGIEGRPAMPIDTNNTSYESSDGKHHVDYAIRWFTYFDEWELGLSHFSGTGREPESFNPNLSTGLLEPYYTLINQSGVDLQALIEDWTWKLEIISRENSTERFLALTGGFEYTIVGIGDTQADLGIVIEYLYDDRNRLASSPFQNDLATAFRYVLNDVQSTEILFGFITDLDDDDISSFVEASRRLGDSFKIEIEARSFNSSNSSSPTYGFRKDDFIQADLAWYF